LICYHAKKHGLVVAAVYDNTQLQYVLKSIFEIIVLISSLQVFRQNKELVEINRTVAISIDLVNLKVSIMLADQNLKHSLETFFHGSLTISWSSDSEGFIPKDLRTVSSSALVMVPSLSAKFV
jgi:hypothetical protein